MRRACSPARPSSAGSGPADAVGSLAPATTVEGAVASPAQVSSASGAPGTVASCTRGDGGGRDGRVSTGPSSRVASPSIRGGRPFQSSLMSSARSYSVIEG